MTNPPLPNVPFPFPLVYPVATLFHDWMKHIQTPPGEFVMVVPFKLVLFSYEEVLYSYGYLFGTGLGEVLTGHAFFEDEDYSWNPELGWQGGDSLGPPSRRKLPVTAQLKMLPGHAEIDLTFGGPGQFHYTAALNAVSGHDAQYASATVLTGDRTGTTGGGKALAAFSKENIEKTHWPLTW